jgi:hypothetical protein
MLCNDSFKLQLLSLLKAGPTRKERWMRADLRYGLRQPHLSRWVGGQGPEFHSAVRALAHGLHGPLPR